MKALNSLVLSLSILSGLGIVQNLFAQNKGQTIRGEVVESASRMPVPFATVVVMGTDPVLGTISDMEGKFRIGSAPLGRISIKVSCLGYEPVILNELLLTSSKELFLTVPMDISVQETAEVLIQAQIAKEKTLNPMALIGGRLLSTEEASRFAGGFDDPARLAASLAGPSGSMNNNGIALRGNAPKAMQWKLEGVEIPNPNHFADLNTFGGGGLTALSSHVLDNSDFLTSAFPADYANAVSGVFDMQMRRGSNEQYEQTVQLGIIGTDVALEGPIGKPGRASYLLNYRYSTLSLIQPLLPEDAEGINYQDLAYKLSFPHPKAGLFETWGLGLRDVSGQKAKLDPRAWKYDQDRESGSPEQHMGAAGVAHTYYIQDKLRVQTRISGITSGLNWNMTWLTDSLEEVPQRRVKDEQLDLGLESYVSGTYLNYWTWKLGGRITRKHYSLMLAERGSGNGALVTMVDKDGRAHLYNGYFSNLFRVGSWNLSGGINVQWFDLNQQFLAEPRMGVSYSLSQEKKIGLGYGEHSRLERLSVYHLSGPQQNYPNRNLKLMRSRHYVVQYSQDLGKGRLVRVEPYYQFNYDVPVIKDSSYALSNATMDRFLNADLKNSGKGRNMGLDVSLEQFMRNGYYYLLSSGVLRSEYQGGDGIWRPSAFDRPYVFRILGGKEWQLGSKGNKLIGANAQASYQAGERFTPVLIQESLDQQKVIYDGHEAFSRQRKPYWVIHATINYLVNRPKSTHDLSLKVLNAGLHPDFYGFRYNYFEHSIDEHKELLVIPNLSYKISF